MHEKVWAEYPYGTLVVGCTREAGKHEARVRLLDGIGVQSLSDESECLSGHFSPHRMKARIAVGAV